MPFVYAESNREYGEEDLAFIGVLAEEGSLGEPRALGDLRHRRVLEPPLGEQVESGLLEPPAAVWFPSTHALDSR